MKPLSTLLLLVVTLVCIAAPSGAAQKIALDEKAINRLADVLSKRKIDEDVVKTRGKRGEVFSKYVGSVPLVVSANGIGSAAVVRTNLPEGYSLVVTNDHVVSSSFIDKEKNRIVALGFYDSQLVSEPFSRERFNACVRNRSDAPWCKTIRPALVVATDPSRDLALLLVQDAPKTAIEIPLGVVESVKPGDDVVVIGHPLGLLWSLTTGIVSQVRSQYPTGNSPNTVRATVIQTQAPVNPGNSGGPMVSLDNNRLVGLIFAQSVGQVIRGVATPGAPSDDVQIAAQGLNLAIGVNEVESMVTRVMRELSKRIK